MEFNVATIQLECKKQITHTRKTCAKKIVPYQTAPWEQSDQGLFACFLQQIIFDNKERFVQINQTGSIHFNKSAFREYRCKRQKIWIKYR